MLKNRIDKNFKIKTILPIDKVCKRGYYNAHRKTYYSDMFKQIRKELQQWKENNDCYIICKGMNECVAVVEI